MRAPISLLLLAPPAAAWQDCWTALADCPQVRFESPSLVVDDRLYVFGGFDSQSITVSTRVDVYDPSTDSWSVRADLPSPVTHAGVALDDRTVWLVAGFVGDHPGLATAATWTCDVDLDTWSAGPPLPKPLAGGCLVRFGRTLHWFGGVEADRDTDSPDHFALDLDDAGAGWSSLAPLPSPRNHLSGARLGDRIHAFGGQFGHDTNPTDTDVHHAYDPLADSWTIKAPLPIPRSHFEPGTLVEGGLAVIVSGRSGVNGLGALSDITAYDPLLDAWSALPPLPEPRLGVAAKVIQGRLYATAGAEGDLTPHGATLSRSAGASYGGYLRVNCGGPDHLDSGANVWCSDLAYLDGQAFENDQVPDIAGTAEDELYKTHRTASSAQPMRVSYRVPADDGKYRLVLHFAEIEHGATGHGGPSVGQRVMRFLIEGEPVRNSYDVAEEVGVETATTLTFDFEAAGGAVELLVLSSIGQPMLAAFELISRDDDAWESFCSSDANSTGSVARVHFKGSTSIPAADLRLYAEPVPPGQFGLFFYSQAETDVAFGNGRRCVDHPISRLPVHPVVEGVLAHAIDFGNLPPSGQILAGSTWSFQAWYRDPAAGGANFDSSDALRLRFTN